MENISDKYKDKGISWVCRICLSRHQEDWLLSSLATQYKSG